MEHLDILVDVMVIFLASLPIIFLFGKFKLPSIMGFLAAGIIIGPHGLGIITNTEDIKAMAEVGVVLLLFTIGLEISVSQLIQMKRFLLMAGGLQTGLTIALSAIIFVFLRVELTSAVFYGMLISLSSTAIVLKLLADKNELEAPHGRIALGILIFQDLAVVPMMLMLPVLGAGSGVVISAIMLKLLIAAAVLGIAFAIAKYLMSKILYQLAKLRSREAFTIGVILMILMTGYLTEKVGLSLALGAFLAGIILSESDYSHQVTAEIVPFRDAFNSLFFVSIGMLLDYNYIVQYPLIIVVVTAGIILLKGIIILLVSLIIGYPARVGILSALALSQIGEFSFVLAQAGTQQKLISDEYFNAFIAASIFTMLLTPVFLQLEPWLSGIFSSAGAPGSGLPDDTASKKPELKDHVIIAGFGLNGRNVVRVLGETGIPYVVLELNPVTVRQGKAEGINIVYGDLTRKDVLQQAGVAGANIMVIAISDPASAKLGIRQAKEMNSSIYCIVRTRYVSEIDELLSLGADEVIPEEFETSLQIFSKVLQRYHIPVNIIMKQNNIIRRESYGMLRKETTAEQSLSHIDKILAEGLTETYFVEDSNEQAGKTLRQLNIRALTGATIIAIMRSGKTYANPPGTELLKSGDTLVIYGTHMAVDKAIRLLDME